MVGRIQIGRGWSGDLGTDGTEALELKGWVGLKSNGKIGLYSIVRNWLLYEIKTKRVPGK